MFWNLILVNSLGSLDFLVEESWLHGGEYNEESQLTGSEYTGESITNTKKIHKYSTKFRKSFYTFLTVPGEVVDRKN